eukprot:761776-Hanusia_phi.AAC.3
MVPRSRRSLGRCKHTAAASPATSSFTSYSYLLLLQLLLHHLPPPMLLLRLNLCTPQTLSLNPVRRYAPPPSGCGGGRSDDGGGREGRDGTSDVLSSDLPSRTTMPEFRFAMQDKAWSSCPDEGGDDDFFSQFKQYKVLQCTGSFRSYILQKPEEQSFSLGVSRDRPRNFFTSLGRPEPPPGLDKDDMTDVLQVRANSRLTATQELKQRVLRVMYDAFDNYAPQEVSFLLSCLTDVSDCASKVERMLDLLWQNGPDCGPDGNSLRYLVCILPYYTERMSSERRSEREPERKERTSNVGRGQQLLLDSRFISDFISSLMGFLKKLNDGI